MTYDEIFTFENLYNAHIKARKGKRRKRDVIQFENNLSFNLWNLFYRLRDRTYRISGYHRFDITEPKKREIQALQYKDRIVQHCLCDLYLYPLLTARFIYDNGACQKGKGTDFAIDRLTAFMSQHFKKHGATGYFLKMDVRHYFPSIDHGILKILLDKVVSEPDILSMLHMIIDSFENEPDKGLPMGNQTSQLFALYYLNEIDRIIKEKYKIKYYTRYMDDLILLHHDREYLEACLASLKSFAEDELLIEFNEKTQIIPLKNGVEYVGFHFYLTDTGKVIKRVRTSTKKRYKRRMKKLQTDYAEGKLDLTEVKRSLPGFCGHLSRGHTYRLMQSVHRDFVLRKNTTIDEKEQCVLPMASSGEETQKGKS